MTKLLLTIAAVTALTLSVLAGVLGVFSLATGMGEVTVVLAAIAALTAWIGSRIPVGGRPGLRH